MSNSEWEEVVRALAASSGWTQAVAGLSLPPLPAPAANTGVMPRIEHLLPLADNGVDDSLAQVRLPKQASSDGESTVATVLKTIGMVTGVGPLGTGLFKLFGGGDGEKSVPEPMLFSMPSPIAIEAGIAHDRSIVPISYSQDGTARDVRTQSQPAQIQINVNAMDSRSFLDHRDEIAQAVREAMLHSHSLNDVVAEI